MCIATQCRFTPDNSSFGLNITSDGRCVKHMAANFDHHWALTDAPVRTFRVRIVRNPLRGGLLVGLALPSSPLRNRHIEREARRLSRQISKSGVDMKRPQRILEAVPSIVPSVTVSCEFPEHRPIDAERSINSGGRMHAEAGGGDSEDDEDEGERFPAKRNASEESFYANSYMLEMRSGALFERGVWGPTQGIGHNVLEGSLVCVEKNYSSRSIRFIIRPSPRPDHQLGAAGHQTQATGVETTRRHTAAKEEQGLTGVIYGWRTTGLNADQFDSLVGAVMMYINGDEVRIEDTEN